MKLGKIILAIILLIVIVWVVVANTKKGPADVVTQEPIKIGVIMPLSGDAAAYGEPVNNGVKLAAQELNAADGIGGRQIELIIEDGKCNGKDAATAAQKLVSVDKVKYIIGGVCSSEVLGYAPITNTAGVLTISPGATNPKVSEAGDFVFRTALNDGARGVLIADYALKIAKKPALINEKTDFAQGLKESFMARAGEVGLKIVANEDFASDIKDFRAVLTKIKQSGADLIFINTQAPAGLVRIAQQARELGITAPFVASEFNSPEVIAGGKNTEGLVVVVAPELAAEGKAKSLVESYKTTYGKDISFPFYVAAAYDDLHLIANAITNVGDDPIKVKDFLYGLKDYDGTIGKISFDKNGDMTGVGFIFQKLENGKFVNIQ